MHKTQKKTSRDDIARVIEPIWQFFEDASKVVGTSYYNYTRQSRGLAIRDNEFIANDYDEHHSSQISAHKQIEIKHELAFEKTCILDNLHRLLSHIPPLTAQGRTIEIRLHLKNDYSPEPEILIDGVSLSNSTDLKDFVKKINLFVRTHENIDLTGPLEPYEFAQGNPHYDKRFPICANGPVNALLRYASCMPHIRKLIRNGEILRCAPINHPSNEEMMKILSSRVSPPATQMGGTIARTDP